MASIYVQGVYTSLDKVGSMYSVFIYDLITGMYSCQQRKTCRFGSERRKGVLL